MGRTPKALDAIDRSAASVLLEAANKSGLSRRALAELSGLSLNRLGIILRQETPAATLGEIAAIGHALGIPTSVILDSAEQ